MDEPSRSERARRSTRSKLALTALALALGLAGAEAAARLAGWEGVPRSRRFGPPTRYSDNPVLVYENRRDTVVAHGVQTSDGPPRLISLRLNEAGFRGPPLEPEASGALRVACVGDSHTFGHGVEEDEAWPAVLGRALDAAFPEREIEVLNAGVGGYDVEQEAEWLVERVLPHEPDLVLLQYHVNDVPEDGELPGDTRLLLSLTHPLRGGAIGAVRRVSRFADLVCDGVYRRVWARSFARKQDETYAEGHAGWERAASALRRMRDALDERGIPFAVGLFAYLALRPDGDGLVSDRAFAFVARFCEREGIAVFDASSAFAGRELEALRISVHDLHANARGHALFAESFFAWARERGLFAAALGGPAPPRGESEGAVERAEAGGRPHASR